jgi:hypothetical protein
MAHSEGLTYNNFKVAIALRAAQQAAWFKC